jgi:nitrogen fixation NifU-like protein
MSLRELYQEMIVDHGKHPRNFGALPAANHTHAGHNPLCGDKLVVYVLESNGIVEDLAFQGEGCAISMASASLMTESVKGKSLAEINVLFDLFHHLVTEGKSESDDLGKLEVFGGVAEFPVRVKCASLAWHTLKAALENDPKPVSTE